MRPLSSLADAARLSLICAVTALATLALGPGAGAATPNSFFGVVPQTSLSSKDFERMGAGKVGTVRTLLSWATIDTSSAPDDNEWSGFDPIVLDAARNGIELQPFISGTPTWVARDLDGVGCPASKCALYAPRSAAALAVFRSFVGQAVDRYGPGGEFWAEHPGVPKRPIRVWQIFNEQNSKSFFLPKPSPKRYAKVVAAADDAISARDRSADVVLGGMAELAGSSKAIRGSEYLRRLYDVRGARKSFDAVAVHPYGATIAKVSSQAELYRKVIKRAGDPGASIYVTEVGAGSAGGGNPLNRGKAGQASLLGEIYKYFVKQRNKLNVRAVDWFSWQDSRTSICDWCKSSGLLKAGGQAKPSYKRFTKFTGGRRRAR